MAEDDEVGDLEGVDGEFDARRGAVLAGVGLNNVVIQQVVSDQPADTVVSTDPNKGTNVAVSQQITLKVSSGPSPTATPPTIPPKAP